ELTAHSKEGQRQCSSAVIDLEQYERKRAELAGVECAQYMRVRQDKEWSDIEKAAQSLDDGGGELDEGGNEREVAAHWAQQDVEKRGRRDLAGHLDEIDGKAHLEQRPIRKNVVCRDSSVGKGNQ